MNTDQLVEITKDLEARMLRIDGALAGMGPNHPMFYTYTNAADHLEIAVDDLHSAISHIHNSMADKVIWDLDNQMLRE